ncbi:hypothetical protein ACLOJK_026443 [Asimina triloba]
MESRSLLDEFRMFDKGAFLDLGHPLLNRIAESFVTAAGVVSSFRFHLNEPFPPPRLFPRGAIFVFSCSLSALLVQIGAVQAVSRQAYLTAVVGEKIAIGGPHLDKHQNREVIAAICMLACSGSGFDSNIVQDVAASSKKHQFPGLKGLAAGLYSGLTYGLKEARGTHDWKNSMVAGAVTGAALALTCDEASHEQVVQCAITGAALSTAANLLSGIF